MTVIHGEINQKSCFKCCMCVVSILFLLVMLHYDQNYGTERKTNKRHLNVVHVLFLSFPLPKHLVVPTYFNY